jgi:hypothetical protein
MNSIHFNSFNNFISAGKMIFQVPTKILHNFNPLNSFDPKSFILPSFPSSYPSIGIAVLHVRAQGNFQLKVIVAHKFTGRRIHRRWRICHHFPFPFLGQLEGGDLVVACRFCSADASSLTTFLAQCDQETFAWLRALEPPVIEWKLTPADDLDLQLQRGGGGKGKWEKQKQQR